MEGGEKTRAKRCFALGIVEPTVVSRFHFKIDAKRTGGIPFMREKLVSRPLLALFSPLPGFETIEFPRV